MTPKYDKVEVRYTDRGGKEHCSICRHYLNYDTCEIVSGDIRPNGWCNRFSHGSK